MLLEADDSVCFGSRAICISRRSLEIIERLGALDGFLKTGLAWTGGRSFYRETEGLHFKMPADENQKLPPMINLAQYSIEQFLLDAAEKRKDRIDIRWQNRLMAIDAREDGARLTVNTPNGDYTMETDWVVAADGGRSFLRETLGLQLKARATRAAMSSSTFCSTANVRQSASLISIRPAIKAQRCWCTNSPTMSGASSINCRTARIRTWRDDHILES